MIKHTKTSIDTEGYATLFDTLHKLVDEGAVSQRLAKKVAAFLNEEAADTKVAVKFDPEILEETMDKYPAHVLDASETDEAESSSQY